MADGPRSESCFANLTRRSPWHKPRQVPATRSQWSPEQSRPSFRPLAAHGHRLLVLFLLHLLVRCRCNGQVCLSGALCNFAFLSCSALKDFADTAVFGLACRFAGHTYGRHASGSSLFQWKGGSGARPAAVPGIQEPQLAQRSPGQQASCANGSRPCPRLCSQAAFRSRLASGVLREPISRAGAGQRGQLAQGGECPGAGTGCCRVAGRQPAPALPAESLCRAFTASTGHSRDRPCGRGNNVIVPRPRKAQTRPRAWLVGQPLLGGNCSYGPSMLSPPLAGCHVKRSGWCWRGGGLSAAKPPHVAQ